MWVGVRVCGGVSVYMCGRRSQPTMYTVRSIYARDTHAPLGRPNVQRQQEGYE